MLRDASGCGTMKQPRLPGAEKFKFSSPAVVGSPAGSRPPSSLASTVQRSDSVTSSKLDSHVRLPARYSQGELNTLLCTLSSHSLNKNDCRRRAVLPITCKKTSRVLNNTNLELNVNHADLVSEEDGKSGRMNLDGNRISSCPNLESSRSLNSSKTSLDAFFRKMSLQNPTIKETSNVDWMNIRASPSRLSASCSSSCSSEENVWVLREDA